MALKGQPTPLMSSRTGHVRSGCVNGFWFNGGKKSPQRKVYKYCGKSIGPLIFHEALGHSARVNSTARSHSAGINGKLLIERHFIQGPWVIQCESFSGRTESRVFPSCTKRKATVTSARSLNAKGLNPPKGKTDSIFLKFISQKTTQKKKWGEER